MLADIEIASCILKDIGAAEIFDENHCYKGISEMEDATASNA